VDTPATRSRCSSVSRAGVDCSRASRWAPRRRSRERRRAARMRNWADHHVAGRRCRYSARLCSACHVSGLRRLVGARGDACLRRHRVPCSGGQQPGTATAEQPAGRRKSIQQGWDVHPRRRYRDDHSPERRPDPWLDCRRKRVGLAHRHPALLPGMPSTLASAAWWIGVRQIGVHPHPGADQVTLSASAVRARPRLPTPLKPGRVGSSRALNRTRLTEPRRAQGSRVGTPGPPTSLSSSMRGGVALGQAGRTSSLQKRSFPARQPLVVMMAFHPGRGVHAHPESGASRAGSTPERSSATRVRAPAGVNPPLITMPCRPSMPPAFVRAST
jgi:hypothetical protein